MTTRPKHELEGQWTDKIVRRQGLGRLTPECLTGRCVHTPEQHRDLAGCTTEETVVRSNQIVTQIGVLLAGYVLGHVAFTPGNLYHAVGEGLVAWDVSTPAPTIGQTALVTEGFRKVVGTVNFLDLLGGSIVAGPTRILRYTTTFDFGDANGLSIREQGLFGGNATGVSGSGQMLNAINHPRVDKNNTFQFIRRIEMRF